METATGWTYASLPFKVWDVLTGDPPAVGLFSSIISEGEVIAVSIVRGHPPLDMALQGAPEGGTVIWSFAASYASSSPASPRRSAAIAFVEALVSHGNESTGSAAIFLERLVRSSGTSCTMTVDGALVDGSIYQVADVGYVVAPVDTSYPFAAACFDGRPIPDFVSDGQSLRSFSLKAG